MKKKIIIITSVIAVLCVGAILIFGNHTEKAKIIVATDTHYLSSSINDKGKAFDEMISLSDGKLVPYCDEIFSAFSSEVIEQKPDVLILSGDLTFNGEKASHEDFAKKLDEIQSSGVQVLAIAGNHDINNRNAFQYTNDEYIPTESVTADEFKELYFNFGMKQAESVDENSLSYIYKVNNDLYVLMLDTNAYGQNFVQDPSYEWIKAQLEMVKKQGAQVLSVSHQNLFAHNDMLSFGYQLYDADELLALFNEYEVKCHLSGHIHTQHIKTDGITEIVTSSLLVSPVQYGVIDFDGNFNYETQRVDVSKWAKEQGIDNLDLNDFTSYADEFFKTSGRNKSLGMIDELDISESDKELAKKAISTLNASYFAGTKIDLSEIQAGIDILKKQDGFTSNYLEIMVNEAQNDYNFAKIEGK